jgi:type I restriction enzyme S subunit
MEKQNYARAEWRLISLSELGRWIGGGTPSKSNQRFWNGGNIPWVSPKDMKTERIADSKDHITEEAVANSTTRLISKGAVLVVVRSGILRHTLPVAIADRDVTINQDLKAVELANGIIPEYVAWALRAAERDILHTCAKAGTTVQNLEIPRFLNYRIPIPPLDEQQRIVAEIEKQFTRLDAGVASLKQVQIALKRYRASALKAACEGQFPHEPISVAIHSLDQGRSPKCEPVPSPSDDVWAIIKTSAIQHGRFIEPENKRLPSALRPRPNLELQPGDLLITRAGPRARAGVTCLIKSTRPRLMLCDKAYRVRAKHEVADPAFLEIVLNAPQIVDAIDELKTGISDSGVNLTQRGFQGLVIPLPPLSEQKRIVADVERRLSVIEELEIVAAATVQRANRLRQAVLRAAFTMPQQSNRDTE